MTYTLLAILAFWFALMFFCFAVYSFHHFFESDKWDREYSSLVLGFICVLTVGALVYLGVFALTTHKEAKVQHQAIYIELESLSEQEFVTQQELSSYLDHIEFSPLLNTDEPYTLDMIIDYEDVTADSEEFAIVINVE